MIDDVMIRVDVRRDAADVTIVVHGELDLATVSSLQRALHEVCHTPGGDVLVDLSDVAFFDAATLGPLAEAAGELRHDGRRLAVHCAGARQQKVLLICRMGLVLTIC